MNTDTLTNSLPTLLNDLSIFFFIKIGIIILLTLYIVFAFVVVKQVRVMTETLEIGFEVPLKSLSYFHLLFAISILIYAIFVL